MTLTLNRRSAYALARWGIGIRLFTASMVDGMAMGNASWISVAMAFMLTLPAALMIGLITRKDRKAMPVSLLDQACGQWLRRAFCLLLCAFSLYEAGYGTRMLSLSMGYAAFDKLPMLVLLLVSIAIGCLACMGGGIGLGGAAQVWHGVFLFIIIVIGVTELSSLHYRWLTPILGPGLEVLLGGALSMAGMNTALVAIWLCMSEETGEDQLGGRTYRPTGPFYMIKELVLIAVGVMIANLIVSMLVPPTPSAPDERSYALSRFIVSGLNMAPLQFPLMMTWFVSQVLMQAFYTYTAACMLKRAFENLKDWICVLLTGVALIPISIGGISDRRWIDTVNLWRLPIVTLPLGVICAVYLVKNRRKRVEQA